MEGVYPVHCKMNFLERYVDPEVQFIYNVSFKNKENVTVVKVFYDIEDKKGFLREINVKVKGEKL